MVMIMLQIATINRYCYNSKINKATTTDKGSKIFFLYSNSKTVKFRPNDQYKSLYKDVPNTIKTAIGYPSKLALDKVSYINFFILAQYYEKITKKFIISGRLCFSLTQTLRSATSTHNYLLILQILQV